MGATMSWYARQMMSYATDDLNISYKYDTNGLRTEKTVNGIKHEYYYVDGLLRSEQIGETYIVNYRYDTDDKLFSVSRYDIDDGDNYILYAQTNTRGDVISLYDGAGATRVVYTYDSWGKLISVTDGSGNELSTDSFAYQISLKYRGYVYDSETGLYYLQSRYYDPETGRFLNADDVDYIGYSGEQLSYNMFAYCENEPVNNSDPLGCLSLNSVKNFFKKVISTIVKYIVGYFEQMIYIKNNILYISTTMLELIINMIISSFCAGKIVKATSSVLKHILNKYKNKKPQWIVNILVWVIKGLDKRGLVKLFAKLLAKILIVNKTIVKDSMIDVIAKDFLSSILLSNTILLKYVNIICSALSSIGGFLAFVIAGFDKYWFDGYLKINIYSFRRKYL